MAVSESKRGKPPGIAFDRPENETLSITLTGSWNISNGLRSTDAIRKDIETDPAIRRIVFRSEELDAWDSSLLTFLMRVVDCCRGRNIEVVKEGLPRGVDRLLEVACAVPEKKDARKGARREPFFSMVGSAAIEFWQSTLEMLSFIGEAFLAFCKLCSGKARYRRSDVALLLEECGVQALPIVSLISVLVGLILAFVGAVQLRLFGAQIYVADLVGLGMAREMGAMMTAIIMAGRTGASFAAQLGTMQVNEEIDAFRTLGISPMEFLVLPRMLALILMLPLLCLYADLMGILGGALIGIGMLDLTPAQYFNETQNAVHLADFAAGLIKSGVFGALVALAGCLRGMQCGRSASAVGEATTSSVVTAIVAIIVSDASLTVIYDILGI